MFKAFIRASENPIGDLDLLCAFRPSKHKRKGKRKESELPEISGGNETPQDEDTRGPDWDNDDGVMDFFNSHMPEFQDIIAKTAEEIDISRYRNQQKYLFAVFEQSSENCWQYVRNIIDNKREEISPDVLEKLTEEEVKETAMAVATTFFVQFAILHLGE